MEGTTNMFHDALQKAEEEISRMTQEQKSKLYHDMAKLVEKEIQSAEQTGLQKPYYGKGIYWTALFEVLEGQKKQGLFS